MKHLHTAQGRKGMDRHDGQPYYCLCDYQFLNRDSSKMKLEQIIERPVIVITAVIIVDIIALVCARNGLVGDVVNTWYERFGFGAFVSDVGSICFGIFLSLALFYYVFPKNSFTLFNFMASLVGIQLVHDLLLALVIREYPARSNRMMDVFKMYVNENGFKILLVDATMMILSALFIYYFVTLDNIVMYTLLAFSLYVAQYLIYS
jgi:hypothetical protein